jgi:hypothetical protein
VEQGTIAIAGPCSLGICGSQGRIGRPETTSQGGAGPAVTRRDRREEAMDGEVDGGRVVLMGIWIGGRGREKGEGGTGEPPDADP